MSDISDNLADNAAAPRRAQGDTGSMEQHSLPDQIAADRYNRTLRNRAAGGMPMRHIKLIPPSPSGITFRDSGGDRSDGCCP